MKRNEKNKKINFAKPIISIITIFLSILPSLSTTIKYCTVSNSNPPITSPCNCLCPADLSIPLCRSGPPYFEDFYCWQGQYPYCIGRYSSQAVTPACFPSSSSSGILSDACCKNCPDGSPPTCPVNTSSSGAIYKYSCVNGVPDCCKKTSAGLDCTSEKDPSCFYPGIQQPIITPPLCTNQTTTCPDGSPISCPAGYNFICFNGFPYCCNEDGTCVDFEPACFYTGQCTKLSPPGSKFCPACPDGSNPSQFCPIGTNYWYVYGKKDCCIVDNNTIFCTTDASDPACTSVLKTKCPTNLTLDAPCCMLCPDGTSPCPTGQELWCINNIPNCCSSGGTSCTGTQPFCFSATTYKCPNTNPLPETGCCKSCPNRVDRPQCSTGTDLWCINGNLDCCKITSYGLLCNSKQGEPSCPIGGTRQCQ